MAKTVDISTVLGYAKAMGGNRRVSDQYTADARKAGYPARSIWKLKEIQEKFNLIPPAAHILDVGASPGSWTLFAVREILGPKGSVVAVDLQDHGMGTVPDNVEFLLGDAFEDPTYTQIKELGPFDSIICDAAPNTTGHKSVDTLRSMVLVEELIALSADILKPGGNLVAKLFQGGDQRELLQMMRETFVSTKWFKPKSCRKDSYETYLIGINKREI